MTTIHVYDLDGTLSKLNNTYDFIYLYLEHKRMYFRFFLGKIVGRILRYFSFIPKYLRRRVEIIVLFIGLKKSDLKIFLESQYLDIFIKSFTPLGEYVKNNIDHNAVLLTGCVNPPAEQIAKLFNFKCFYATEFKEKNGRITGIDLDTYGHLKAAIFPLKKGVHYIYYTDDPVIEKDICELMNETVII